MTKQLDADRRWRRFERQLRRIMEGPDGERCSVCRRVFKSPKATTYSGLTKQGRVAVVGDCCVEELAEVLAIGLFVREEPAWKKDDAAWFKQNSKRTHRLRPAFVGEMEELLTPHWLGVINERGGLHYIAVRQVESGTRLRMPSAWTKNSTLPETEEFAHALFDFLIERGQAENFTPFSRDDIQALARAYETGRVS